MCSAAVLVELGSPMIFSPLPTFGFCCHVVGNVQRWTGVGQEGLHIFFLAISTLLHSRGSLLVKWTPSVVLYIDLGKCDPGSGYEVHVHTRTRAFSISHTHCPSASAAPPYKSHLSNVIIHPAAAATAAAVRPRPPACPFIRWIAAAAA